MDAIDLKLSILAKCMVEADALVEQGLDYETLSCDEFTERYKDWSLKELKCLYKIWLDFKN